MGDRVGDVSFAAAGEEECEVSETNAVHPGAVLREEFMVPLGLTSTALAARLHITLPRINELVRERRSMSADLALRLARYFGTSPQLWMGLQVEYELNLAAASPEIRKIKPRKRGRAARLDTRV